MALFYWIIVKKILITITLNSKNEWLVSLFNNDADREDWCDDEKHEHPYADYDSAIGFAKGLMRSYISMGLKVEIKNILEQQKTCCH